jgi:hypothetical protein
MLQINNHRKGYSSMLTLMPQLSSDEANKHRRKRNNLIAIIGPTEVSAYTATTITESGIHGFVGGRYHFIIP